MVCIKRYIGFERGKESIKDSSRRLHGGGEN